MKLNEKTIKEIIKKLLKQKLTISFAESITGGSAAFSFVSFSGASNYFNSSIVAYTNQQKNKLLNVNPDTLFKYGPVSKEVANEMAINLKLKTTSNICISFTGNAGPIIPENEEFGLTYITIIIDDNLYNFKFISNKKERSEIIIDTLNFAFLNLNNKLK